MPVMASCFSCSATSFVTCSGSIPRSRPKISASRPNKKIAVTPIPLAPRPSKNLFIYGGTASAEHAYQFLLGLFYAEPVPPFPECDPQQPKQYGGVQTPAL